MKRYRSCVPQKAPDGRVYVHPADPRGEVDVYHIRDEVAAGRAAEVVCVRAVTDEEDVPDGGMVCFGRVPTLWVFVVVEEGES